MSFLALAACLILATFAAAATAGSLLSLAVWAVLARRRRALGPDGILLVRALPAALAAALALGVVAPAFVAFEPARAEAPGAPLMALAAVGGLLLGAAAIRLARARAASRRLLGRCEGPAPLPGADVLAAHAITHTFPLVAVVGARAPRLVVARHVLQALEAPELEAVVRHEAAHVRAGDNAKALLLRALPDPLALLPAARRMEAAWRQAAERSADAAAAPAGTAQAADLASALLKLARLVPPGSRAPLALPALLDGAPIEQRVLRLLGEGDPTPSRPPAAAAWLAGLLAAAWLLAAAGTPVLLRVHAVIEAVVRGLR